MPHASSPAAVHAAKTLFKHFRFEVIPAERLPGSVSRIPNLQASMEYLSVFLDMTTNAHLVSDLRDELYHWVWKLHHAYPEPIKLLVFVRHMIDEMEKVPQAKHLEDLPRFNFFAPPTITLRGNTQTHLSQSSIEAVKYICTYFTVTPITMSFIHDDAMKLQLGIMIESSLGLRKAMNCLPYAKKCAALMERGQLSLEQIKKYFREFGVLLESLGSYEDRREQRKLLV